MARGPVRFEATAGRIGPCGRSTTRPKPSRESEVAHEHPLAVNGENSRAKVPNVRGDSSALVPRLLHIRPQFAPSALIVSGLRAVQFRKIQGSSWTLLPTTLSENRYLSRSR